MKDNRPVFLLCTTKHTVAAITNTTTAIEAHGTTTEMMMIVLLFTEGALLPSPDSVVLATELEVALVVVPKVVFGTCVVMGVVRSVVELDVVVCTSIVVVLSVVASLSSVVPGIVVGKSVISGVV